MSVKVDDIRTEFGNYYLNNGQNKSRLLGVPTIETETLAIPGVRHISTDETIYQLANPMFSSVLQGFQKEFTAKGQVDFHPSTIQLRKMKVDDTIDPESIEDTWLGFLAGDSSKNLEDWPIVRYLFEVYYAQQLAEDKELSAVYNGVYKAATSGTASDAKDVFDGFHKLLQKGATDDYPINTVTVGALAKATVFDQVEAFSMGIASQYANKNIVIFCSPEMERYYRMKKRELGYYDVQADNAGALGTRIDFTNHVLKGVQSMTGSTDIWATMPENIIHLKKRNENLTNIDVQKDIRDVKIIMDWWEAVGFGCNKLVWASDTTVAE